MVDRLKREYGELVTVVWKAYELLPEPHVEPRADTPERRQCWEASVLPMAAERGLLMRLPRAVSPSRLAFEAVELARDHRKFDLVHRAIFQAYFRDGADIGDPDVLAEIFESAGLAPALLSRVIACGTYRRRVADQQQLARDLGIAGVPAMLVGPDIESAEVVMGAVPCDWLREAVERALCRQKDRIIG